MTEGLKVFLVDLRKGAQGIFKLEFRKRILSVRKNADVCIFDHEARCCDCACGSKKFWFSCEAHPVLRRQYIGVSSGQI